MLSNILDRISLISLSLVIVLLPIFFLPFAKIPVETSKGLLLVIGLAVSVITYAAARFSDGKISIPRSPLFISGLGIVVVTLISAITSSASNVSMFGILLDAGTFWYIAALFILMFFSAMLIKDVARARMLLLGLISVLAVVFLFQMARFFNPNTLSFGVLGGKVDNLIGSWNTFGILTGFFSLISLFAIEFFNLSKAFKWALGLLLLLALVLSAAVNFTVVWELLGIFSLLIFVYKISISSAVKKEGENGAYFPAFSFAMVMISLLFFMSGQFIGGFLPNKLGLTNVEIRPSLSATFTVAKNSLRHDPVFGIGPNRFGESWGSYKPIVINNTQFWNSNFSIGSGTIPTMMVNTGIAGTIAWTIFFVLLLLAGTRTLFTGIRKGANNDATLYFVAALYLFAASWFYAVGFVVLLLAFALTGIFIGLSLRGQKDFELAFLTDPRKSFFFILALIGVMILSAGLSFKYIERFASVNYFSKTFSSQTIDEAEGRINKAIILNSNDLYLRTANQVYLTKINTLVSKGSALTDAEKGELQTAFSLAEQSALMAVNYNRYNYVNHQTLGATYNVAGSLGVAGAYDKAIASFQNASALNPLNPGLKLVIARSYISAGKVSEAKPFAQEALSLKPDYLDGLIVMSQIEKALGNNAAAISYAEGALALLPANEELINYVNSLKSGTSYTPPSIPSAPENIENIETE